MSSPSWTMPSPVSGPPIMSREFLRRAKRVKAAANPDQATAQTVEIMCKLIHESAKDPLISRYALEAVRQWRGGAQFASTGQDALSDPLAIAESIWWWCKHSMTFVHHSKQILVWLGERDQLQLLIEPSVLVRMKQMEGDCAIYSMLICAMLECLGIDWELQTLATNPGQPDIYNHVFLRVVLPNGRRIPFDCSHGKYPGWRVPENNVLRSQVWDESGAAVPDAAEYQGLGSYVQNPNPWWFTGNAGLGQDTTDTTDTTLPPIDTLPSGSTLSDLTGTLPPMGPTVIDTSTGSSVSLDSLATSIGVDPSLLNQTSYNSSTGLVTTSSGALVAPSQSSAAWAAFATAMTKAGVQLATIATIQPGTAILPNGTIVSVPAGQSLQSTFGNLFSSMGAAGSYMPMILLGLGAVLVFSMIGGRR